MTHNMEIYIRETCNEFYRIIISRKGILLVQERRNFPDHATSSEYGSVHCVRHGATTCQVWK